MAFTYEWFRYERLMIAARCCGAAERLIDEATGFAQQRCSSAERSSSTRRSRTCSPIPSPSCGRHG